MQKADQSHRGSPDWLTEKIEEFRVEFERNWAATFTSMRGIYFYLIFLISTAFVYGASLTLIRNLTDDSVHLKIDKIYFFYPLMAFSSILIFWLLRVLPSLANNLTRLLFYFAILAVFSLKEDYHIDFYLFFFQTFILCVAYCGFLFSRRISINQRIVLAIVLSIAVLNFACWLYSGWAEFNLLEINLPQRFLFLIYLGFIDSSASITESKELFIKQLLFPGQIFYPIPNQAYYWEEKPSEKKIENHVSGVIDIFICSLYGFLLFQCQTLYPKNPEHTNFILYGLYQYICLYLFSCISITTPVAMAKIMGYSMPAAYRNPLLAASPPDRWRRWNTYFYNFYCWIFYIPFYKKTRSLFAAVMLTFIITSLFHTLAVNPLNFTKGFSIERFFNSELCFFLAHGILVYIGLKVKTSVLDGGKLQGWFGVLVTYLAMCLIQGFRMLL